MIIPTNFAQVNYYFSGPGFTRGAQVVMGVNNTAASHDAASVAQLMADNWESNILPLQSAALTLVEVRAKLGPNATGPDAVVGVGTVGGVADAVAPPNVAVLIRKLTAAGGRKNRGRTYLPGTADVSVLADGAYDATDLATLQGAMDDYLAQALGDDLPIMLLHSHVDDAPTFVTGFAVQAKVATQRRRLRK